MWIDSHTNKKEVVHRMLQEHIFFNSLCKQTQYDIVYETGRISDFNKGEKILNIHQRSPWNSEDALFYRVDDCCAEPTDIEIVAKQNPCQIDIHTAHNHKSLYQGMLNRNSCEAQYTREIIHRHNLFHVDMDTAEADLFEK